jgi:RIO kinase 2
LSSVERAARVLKSIKDEEWRTLAGMERASMTQGTTNVGMISRLSRLPMERVAFALDQLERRELLGRIGQSYHLRREAIELMALRDYVKKDLVAALGAIIAKGKESDVYEAYTEEGSLYALKFYKLGRTSFTRVRQKRFTERGDMRNWIAINYEAAKREYRALRKLGGLSDAFPRAFSYSRSTVLLQQVSGFRLSERPELPDPSKALEAILEAVKLAFLHAGLVNGDLSEYNILTNGEALWLIDWPQAVSTDHPNFRELLGHDVKSIVNFFGRAYRVKLSVEVGLEFVTGSREQIDWPSERE